MECKVVLVGDSMCGKSTLVHKFANGNFLSVYTPTDFERLTVDHPVGGIDVTFILWDTSGSSTYDTVRPLCYKDARAFLLCFDLSSPASLHNAHKKWFSEIRSHSSAPVVLCGCKSDLQNQLKESVTYEQALSFSRQMTCTAFLETSSVPSEGGGTADALELCALAAMNKPRFASLVRRRAPHLRKHLQTHHQCACRIM